MARANHNVNYVNAEFPPRININEIPHLCNKYIDGLEDLALKKALQTVGRIFSENKHLIYVVQRDLYNQEILNLIDATNIKDSYPNNPLYYIPLCFRWATIFNGLHNEIFAIQ